MNARATLTLLGIAALSTAMGPLEMNEPTIAEGMSAFEQGDYETALKKFEDAEKLKPSDPRVHFNRAAALHKLGRNADAQTALQRAEELDFKKEYANQIHYNRGNIAVSENKREEAVREYRKALRANPQDALSRHNLEVVLRDLPPPAPSNDGGAPDGGGDGGRRDGGSPDAGHSDGGSNDGGSDGGGSDGGSPDAGPPDGGGADSGTPDGGGDGGSDGGQGTDGGQPGDGGAQDGGGPPQPSDAGGGDGGAQMTDAGFSAAEAGELDGGIDLSKQEAERLLDSLKRNEKNLQLWRFKQRSKQPDHGKDW